MLISNKGTNDITYKKHWSFIVTDKKYMYVIVFVLSICGLLAAFYLKNPTSFSRMGNFITVIGVWISMRFTLREGINKHKNAYASTPVFPNGQINAKYFNDIGFAIGDAHLQIHGLAIMIYGACVGSFGDILMGIFLR